MIVELTGAEMAAAYYIAAGRTWRNRDREPRNGQDKRTAYLDNLTGALGEVVVAKALDRFYIGGEPFPDGGAADVGPFHVRTGRLPTYRLLLHPWDVDDEPFLLVVNEGPPRFRIVGWIDGRDGKRDEYWGVPPGQPEHRACYIVPTARLASFLDHPFVRGAQVPS